MCCMSLISINERQTVRHNNEWCSATVCGENTTLCSNLHKQILKEKIHSSRQYMQQTGYVLAVSRAVPKQSNGGRLPSKAGSFVYLDKSISEHGVTSGFVTTNVSNSLVFSNMLLVYPCVFVAPGKLSTDKDLSCLKKKSFIYSLI